MAATGGSGEVVVAFQATAGAPRMRQRRFVFRGEQRWEEVVEFLRTRGLRTREPVHCFVNATFQPSPDARLDDLCRWHYRAPPAPSSDAPPTRTICVQYAFASAWG